MQYTVLLGRATVLLEAGKIILQITNTTILKCKNIRMSELLQHPQNFSSRFLRNAKNQLIFLNDWGTAQAHQN